MPTGIIFNIKRFAVHDGPGIRTTVFFKGCPLRCLPCHNPESQSFGYEVFLRPERGDLCPRCRQTACAAALTDDGTWEDLPRLAAGMCPGCAEALLAGAVERVGRKVDPATLLDELERDRVFFERSGGGVTLSGGEPLAQPEFLFEVLRACRERGLHTCVDTSGAAPTEVVTEVAELADLILFDVKAVSPRLHLRLTGITPEPIQENLRFLCAHGVPLVVRVPLIPGWNDHEEEVDRLADRLSCLPGPPAVDILPYHRIGRDKYGRLRRALPLPDAFPPSPSAVGRTAARLESRGLRVQVRGEAYVTH